MAKKTTRRRGAAAGMMMMATVLALGVLGCAQDRVNRLPQAGAAYDQGDYALAYREAVSMAGFRDPAVRGEALYLAGMAAMKQNQLGPAQEYLKLAAQSADQSLRADALVNLGLVEARLGRHQAAAHHLLAAAADLQGQDRANAYYHAALAQQKLGQWSSARTNLMLARKATPDSGFQGQVSAQVALTGYTIQVAAFASEENARKTAAALTEAAAAAGLGSPRLTPRTDGQGRPLTAVQIGQFTTYQSAAAARAKLGAPQAMIVPLAEP
jgi:tetratricopeptide (TPR) repeat protein